jgi:hypothetical protein
VETLVEKEVITRYEDATPVASGYKWYQIPFSDPVAMIKLGLWAYFLLLLFEGALRKWFLAPLAGPLLIIRDPVAFYIIIKCIRHRIFPSSGYTQIMTFIGVAGVFTALAVGHGNIMVAMYGARILLLHFPLMFIMGRIFTREDIVKLMRFTLIIGLPMAILTAAQFYSPQSAWVNRGVGGSMEGAGFSGTGEYLRPPGTFSFTTGNVQFFSLMGPFVFYFFFFKKQINKFFLISAFIGLMIAIPLSISRSLLLNTLITTLVSLMATLRKTKYLGQMFTLMIVAIVALVILSQTSFFNTSVGAFTERFEVAGNAEGGAENAFVDRVFGGMIKGIAAATEPDKSFFGMGIGLGTNVGANLLSASGVFMISEDEWGRIIGEMGPLFGLTIIFMRISMVLTLSVASYSHLKKGDLLPWILMAYGFLSLLNGQWAQPTSLGFSIMIGGLWMASVDKKL